MPFIVEFTSNFNSCIFFGGGGGGTNTSVKFGAKIARGLTDHYPLKEEPSVYEVLLFWELKCGQVHV